MRPHFPVLAVAAALLTTAPAGQAREADVEAGAAASTIGVVDWSRTCSDPNGCLRRKPSRWVPSMIPRNGTSWVFQNIHWKRWGRASATATTRARGCAGQVTCNHFTVILHLRVFKRSRIPGHSSKAYRCMAITRAAPAAPEYIYAHYIIADEANAVGSTCG